MIQNSSYEEHIRLICKCEHFIEDDLDNYLDETHSLENSEISRYFWDKGFDEAMVLVNHFEKENEKIKKLLKRSYPYLMTLEPDDEIDMMDMDDLVDTIKSLIK